MFRLEMTFDARFHCPSSFILCGPSGCGKTTFVHGLLREADKLFHKPSCKENVILFYSHWQDAYQTMKDEKLIHKFVQQLPTVESVKELTLGFRFGGSVIILDDLQNEFDSEVVKLYREVAHHCNCVVISLCQTVFSANKFFREIAINSSYTILLRPRAICFQYQT